MLIYINAEDMRSFSRAERKKNNTVALVPTMVRSSPLPNSGVNFGASKAPDPEACSLSAGLPTRGTCVVDQSGEVHLPAVRIFANNALCERPAPEARARLPFTGLKLTSWSSRFMSTPLR